MKDLKIEITSEEKRELGKAMILASEHPKKQKVNWEVIAKFLAKVGKSSVV